MAEREMDRLATAGLLRELAAELLVAEGPARNGLFLELHRLQDTIFRLALEAHPDAAPMLAAQAFAIKEALPAPQVVRELHGLESELVTAEIRRLYKHMNAVRNNMAHESLLARVTVSRRNSRQMAHLARLLADRLDPARHALPAAAGPVAASRPRVSGTGLVWLGGAVLGAAGMAAWQQGALPLLLLLLTLLLFGTMWGWLRAR